MGTLFVARDTQLDRQLVAKFLLPEHVNNRQITQRFLQEGRSLAKVVHPGIVTVYETGEVQGTRTGADGSAYILMELLDGETLAQRLARAGRLSVSAAMEVCRQVANALQAAHEAGIVHRDLKPENIMLVKDPSLVLGERAKVLDFGIAKSAKSAAGDEATAASLVFGTPIYMSPEQAKSTASAGPSSDIYSLGCILFELLVGKPPFDGTAIQLISAHILKPPPVPSSLAPGIPPHLDQVIGAMMAKAPEGRPASMKVVEAILEEDRVLASMSRRRTLGGAMLVTPLPGGPQPSSPAAALASSGPAMIVRTPAMGVPVSSPVAFAPTAPPAVPTSEAPPAPPPSSLPLMPSPETLAAASAETTVPDPMRMAPAHWRAGSAPQPAPDAPRAVLALPGILAAPAAPPVAAALPVMAAPPVAAPPAVRPAHPTTLSSLSGASTPAPARKGGKAVYIGLALAILAGGAIALAAVSGGGGDGDTNEPQPAAAPADRPATSVPPPALPAVDAAMSATTPVDAAAPADAAKPAVETRPAKVITIKSQ